MQQQLVWVDTAKWKDWCQDPNPNPAHCESYESRWKAQGAALCETWGTSANNAATELLRQLEGQQSQQVSNSCCKPDATDQPMPTTMLY